MIRGPRPRAATSASRRGLRAGGEMEDAWALFPGGRWGGVPLGGSGRVTRLYQAALLEIGVATHAVASADAVVRGFCALHAMTAAAR